MGKGTIHGLDSVKDLGRGRQVYLDVSWRPRRKDFAEYQPPTPVRQPLAAAADLRNQKTEIMWERGRSMA